jgi:CHASE domain
LSVLRAAGATGRRRPRRRGNSDAKTQLTDASEQLGCYSIAFVDLTLHTAWAYPLTNNEGAVGFDHAATEEWRLALQQARLSGGPAVSATTFVPQAPSEWKVWPGSAHSVICTEGKRGAIL